MSDNANFSTPNQGGQDSSQSVQTAASSAAGQAAATPIQASGSTGGTLDGQSEVTEVPAGQSAAQPCANPVMEIPRPLGSSKPPKFTDTFEVYQKRLKLYLEQRDSWEVVTGEETRPATDPVLQRQFDMRNRLAMETIIRGVQDDDAQKRELYTHPFKPGQKMADYIQEMNALRQRLQHMGPNFVIDDTSMSQLLLMGVCAVPREILTQFDFSYRQGNPPTLQQVKNALLSRDEMDKMAADTAGASGVQDSGSQVVMQMGQTSCQGPATKGQVQTTGAGKKRAIRCYYCKKLNHMRRDCWYCKANKNKGQDTKGNEQGKENKRKKGGKGGNDGAKQDKPATSGAMGYMRFVAHAHQQNESSSSSSSESEGFIGMATKRDRHHGPKGDWMLDSGTTAHVCTERELFTSFKKSTSSFKIWNGEITHGKECGTVVIPAMDKLSQNEMTLLVENVEFTPSGPVNILSLGVMIESGWALTTSDPKELPCKMFLTRNGKCLEFIFHGRHYWLNNGTFGEAKSVAMATVNADSSPLMKWHERLAHLNEASLKFMVKNHIVDGMNIPSEHLKARLKCSSCMSAKQKRMSYGNATSKRTTVSFERLTSDVCDMGKLLPGLGASRYFQLIHDEGSRYKWCFMLGRKNEAAGNVQRLMSQLLARGKKIKTFTSDGGGEYVNNTLKEFLEKNGIVFIPTHPYTPEENCLVEKLNGVLVNKMRAVMLAANLPTVLWPEVLQYVVEVDNLSPTKALKGLTPTEKLTGLKPSVEQLKVCGCVGYVFVPKEIRKHKLSAKAEPALFLGFPKSGHGYRLLHLRTGKMIEARDVKFREDVTVERTYINALLKGRQSYYPQIPFIPLPVEYVAEQTVRSNAGTVVREAVATVEHQTRSEENEVSRDETDSVGVAGIPEDESGREDVESDKIVTGAMPTTDDLLPWSQRKANQNTRAGSQPRHSSKRKRGLRRSQRKKLENVRLKNYVMASMEALTGNPSCVEEALESPFRDKWLEAMELEMEAHQINGTWKLVDRPKEPCNVLKSTWVLKAKLNEKGKVDRYKARLAVKGCGQQYGVDYVDTYSPVVRIETVRMLLLLAFLLDLDCYHVDFVTAFLNGELDGVKIYMEQPDHFHDGTDRICELLKGLYGLKQASRLWYQTLHKHLIDIGFTQCDFDVGLYQRWKDGHVVYVTVYVDDLLVASKSEDIEEVIEKLSAKFALKNLGRVKHILAMEVNFIPGEVLTISQAAYIDRVLERFGMSDARPLGSPLMQNEKLPPKETDPNKINDPNIPFRELVGVLQYLVACTRPDLANAVRSISRYASAYTKENFQCAKRLLRYLRGTRDYGLVYKREGDVLPLRINAFCDADHANCPDTSWSNTGYLLQLNGCCFMYKSKQQGKVTTATCSSELTAASKCVEDLIWARKLLKEIRGEAPPCSTLFIDNQSAIKVMTEHGNYKQMKTAAKKSRKIAEYVKKEQDSSPVCLECEQYCGHFHESVGTSSVPESSPSAER